MSMLKASSSRAVAAKRVAPAAPKLALAGAATLAGLAAAAAPVR